MKRIKNYIICAICTLALMAGVQEQLNAWPGQLSPQDKCDLEGGTWNIRTGECEFQ